MNVRVLEAGDGPLLVCLHGIGSSARSFAPQLSGLDGELRVVAWDAPGYGESPPVEASGIAAYGDEVAELIQSYHEPAVLLGVSWGGVIAIDVALRHRELVAGMVLVSASRGSGRSKASAAAMVQRVEELDRLGVRAFAERRAPALLSPSAAPELSAEVVRTMSASLHPEGHRRAADVMGTTDHSDSLARVDVPTLIICGSEDPVTGVPEGEALARGIRDSTLVVLRGVGHLANQEAATAVNAWVGSFAAIVSASRAGAGATGR
jgi:3-oxoadipate enol-lactonase